MYVRLHACMYRSESEGETRCVYVCKHVWKHSTITTQVECAHALCPCQHVLRFSKKPEKKPSLRQRAHRSWHRLPIERVSNAPRPPLSIFIVLRVKTLVRVACIFCGGDTQPRSRGEQTAVWAPWLLCRRIGAMEKKNTTAPVLEGTRGRLGTMGGPNRNPPTAPLYAQKVCIIRHDAMR